MIRNLETYHGIKLTHHNTKTASEVLDIAKIELEQNRPVIMYLSSFWNPWDSNYQQVAFHHFCLLVGLDSEGKGLYCVDPYHSKENIFLPMDNFVNGCGPCMTFSITDEIRS